MPGQALAGHKLSINYGFDKIRFPSPVKVGAKIRATSTLKTRMHATQTTKCGMQHINNTWIVGHIGRGNRVVVPACVVSYAHWVYCVSPFANYIHALFHKEKDCQSSLGKLFHQQTVKNSRILYVIMLLIQCYDMYVCPLYII